MAGTENHAPRHAARGSEIVPAPRRGGVAPRSPGSGGPDTSDDPEAAELDRICLHNLLDAHPQAVFFRDLEGRYLRLSRAHAYALGHDEPGELVGRTPFDVLPEDEARRVAEDATSIMRTGVPVVELQERVVRAEREDAWQVTTMLPLRDLGGRTIGTFGVTSDITARKAMEEQAREHAAAAEQAHAELSRVELELRTILDASPDPTVRFDSDLRVRYANPAARELLGGDVVGRPATDLAEGGLLDEGVLGALRRTVNGGGGAELEHALHAPDADLFLHTRVVAERDADGRTMGVLAVSRDLTSRKRAEDELALGAFNDPITGLANRLLLTDRLQRAVLRRDRDPGLLAVLLLDLDRFKVVNDSLGHGAGDALLREIGDRLRVVARKVDTVARLGGDEFVVLCERLTSTEDVALVADRVNRAVAEPFEYEGNAIHPSASIGIVTAATSATTPEILLRDAEAAMYSAKQRSLGQGGYRFFDEGVRSRAVARLTVESELREALRHEEFSLLYQPVWDLQTRALVGTEALIRWQRPDGRLVSPADFIPIAEDTGLIVQIGRWVLDEAVRRVASWNARRPVDRLLTMAVNISARQLSDPDLVDDVAGGLERHAVAAEQLCLEITETALLEDALASAEVLQRISRLGVSLALDDFGTGYSSLGHLRRYPVDVLKIDRMFVDGLDGGGDGGAIVGAVTAMAHALGMTTVGEGIETEAQLELLTRLGCDEGQGYLLARPLTPEAMLPHLAPWEPA